MHLQHLLTTYLHFSISIIKVLKFIETSLHLVSLNPNELSQALSSVFKTLAVFIAFCSSLIKFTLTILVFVTQILIFPSQNLPCDSLYLNFPQFQVSLPHLINL